MKFDQLFCVAKNCSKSYCLTYELSAAKCEIQFQTVCQQLLVRSILYLVMSHES
jgi:hypothetical protein